VSGLYNRPDFIQSRPRDGRNRLGRPATVSILRDLGHPKDISLRFG
jgi:hypothetical protein